MNCQHFMNVVVDLVRNGGLEEPARSQALLHAQSCPGCSRHLARQRALSLALHQPDFCESPPHVEMMVLAAYRSRFAAAVDTSPRMNRGMWSLAAAAAILLALTGTWLLIPRQHPQPPLSRQAQALRSTVQPPQAPVTIRAAGEAPRPAMVPVKAPEAKRAAPKPAPQPVAEPEIATDFIPLASSTEISAMESGQFVRVLLPRRAMASFGLPYSQDLADAPVSAQVLIGQDGVARAIRFLNDPKMNSYVQTGLHSKR